MGKADEAIRRSVKSMGAAAMSTRKLLLYAIIPAVIAGLFSISPKLYDIAIEPNARLTYTVTQGPELESGGQYRKIISVKVVNSGKKGLHRVQAELELPAGQFEGSRVQESSGLRPSVRESKTAISVEISTLHPREEFTIVAMVLIPDTTKPERFSLRSDEVLGTDEPASRENRRSSDFIGAILSGMSVFVMTVIVASKRFRSFGYEREDNIFYLLMRLGITEISDQMKFSKNPMTYLRTADVLLDIGLRGPDDTRAQCLKALKCLLLIGNMAPSSLKVVKRNIQLLSGKSYSSDELAKIRKHATSFFGESNIRDKIDKYISTPESFALIERNPEIKTERSTEETDETRK